MGKVRDCIWAWPLIVLRVSQLRGRQNLLRCFLHPCICVVVQVHRVLWPCSGGCVHGGVFISIINMQWGRVEGVFHVGFFAGSAELPFVKLDAKSLTLFLFIREDFGLSPKVVRSESTRLHSSCDSARGVWVDIESLPSSNSGAGRCAELVWATTVVFSFYRVRLTDAASDHGVWRLSRLKVHVFQEVETAIVVTTLLHRDRQYGVKGPARLKHSTFISVRIATFAWCGTSASASIHDLS
eukprot:34340_3